MDDDLEALEERCTRALAGHGPTRAADLLATIPPDTAVDRYGDGGVVAELEGEVAALLGRAAAVSLPSGTMAQQAVLRVHAARTGRRTVVFHPESHLDRHEGRALERLHGLVGRPVGGRLSERHVHPHDAPMRGSRLPRVAWSPRGTPASPT